jgi:streptogramin lyase
VISIREANDGRIWAALDNADLVHLNPETGDMDRVSAAKADLPGTQIAAMLVDESDNLWVKTDKAIARFDAGDGLYYTYPSSREEALNDAAVGVFKNSRGELFFSSVNGIVSFAGGHARH